LKQLRNKSLSALEYHVLLAIVSGPLYGYAIKRSVVTESEGTLRPGAGSLYRVFGRLMSQSLIEEQVPVEAPLHPGLARKYYGLTRLGRRVLAAEARRLRTTSALAAKRLAALEKDAQ